MSDKQPDPVEVFRNLVTEWERGFDAMANKIMGTEEFSRSMNQVQDLQLNMQKRFNEAMADQLTTFNVPSRDDILRLGESIRGLDKRLSKIEMLLAKQSKKGGKGKKGKKKHGGPPRTKQPPSAQREQTDE
jgi:hypothetical protein